MKIKGRTVGTTMPRSDLAQTDPKKADYIKGREMVTDHITAKGNVHGVTAEEVGAEAAGTAQSLLGTHNTNTAAHNDMRILIAELADRLNALANSDDTTLDQMAEVVAYIKDNRELIESITTSKVNVADIIDNLYTNVADKPLSAAQGVALKSLVDSLAMFVEREVAGNAIVIEDAAEAPLNGLTLYGKTTQDGTPTPDAPVELVSAGADGDISVSVYGKNLASDVWTNTEANQYHDALRCKVPLHPNTKYTVSFVVAAGYTGYANEIFAEYGAITGTGQRQSITLTTGDTVGETDADGRYTIYKNSDSGIVPDFSDVQIELGETATDYEQYKEAQSATFATPNGLAGIPVSSGGNYTDADGQQWICDEIDLARGVYVQRLAQEVITEAKAFGETADVPGRFIAGNIFSTEFCSDSVSCLSNFAKWKSWGVGESGTDWMAVVGRNLFYTPAETMTVDGVYSLFAELCESDTPPVVIGALATPIETALSDEEIAAYQALLTNSPNTTILNDGGAWMEVMYDGYNNSFINSVASLVTEHNVSTAAHNDLRTAIDTANTTANAALPKAGGTMTGAIDMGGNRITGLADPVDDTDAVPKSYAEGAFAPVSAVTAVSTAVGGVVLKKINDVVYISVPTGYAAVGAITIPEGYRPSASLSLPCVYTTTSYVDSVGRLKINTDGTVQIQNANGNIVTAGWINICTCYHLQQS